MLLTFTIPSTGHIRSVDLRDELVHEYKLSIQEMSRYFSPALDRQRRAAHNKVAASLVPILKEELPEEDDASLTQEARRIVTGFLEESLTGRSMVRELLDSGLLR